MRVVPQRGPRSEARRPDPPSRARSRSALQPGPPRLGTGFGDPAKGILADRGGPSHGRRSRRRVRFHGLFRPASRRRAPRAQGPRRRRETRAGFSSDPGALMSPELAFHQTGSAFSWMGFLLITAAGSCALLLGLLVLLQSSTPDLLGRAAGSLRARPFVSLGLGVGVTAGLVALASAGKALPPAGA